MNTIKKLMILCIVVGSFSCKAQQLDNGNTNNASDINLIKGTWVAEGATISDKWIFTEDGILKEYTDDLVDIIYSYYIVNDPTPSGRTFTTLKIINQSDNSDWYEYEITHLTNNKLIIVYNRGDGWGIGKPMTYIKQ